jgi:hypothetical protein
MFRVRAGGMSPAAMIVLGNHGRAQDPALLQDSLIFLNLVIRPYLFSSP